MLEEIFWSSKEVGHAPCSTERQPLQPPHDPQAFGAGISIRKEAREKV